MTTPVPLLDDRRQMLTILMRPLMIRKITNQPEQCAIRHKRRHNIGQKNRPIFTPKLPLSTMIRTAMNLTQSRLNMLGLRRHNNVGCMQPNQLLASITKQLTSALIRIDVITLRIRQHNAYLRILKKRAIARLTRLQRQLKLPLTRFNAPATQSSPTPATEPANVTDSGTNPAVAPSNPVDGSSEGSPPNPSLPESAPATPATATAETSPTTS